jgi:uncharacterized protein YgiM (DUF1202 family)
MKRFLLILTIMICTSALIYSQSEGNRRYVAVQTTALKSSASFLAKDLGKLSLGDMVTLVRDNGKWAEVRAGSLSGWVASSSLTTRRIVASSSTIKPSEVPMAGKGFSPDMEIEYKKSGLDYSMVDYMEGIVIPTDDLLQFITEGRLAREE